MQCLGCRLANSIEEVHVVYENKHVCCILDIDPFTEGHTLILPKQHYRDLIDLDIETARAIFEAFQKIAAVLTQLFPTDGISTCQNGGTFNELGHFHLHVIPRVIGDGFNWSDPLLEHGSAERLQETHKKMVEEVRKWEGIEQ